MYAIIQTGGKQYRVRKGDVVRIELLDPGVDSGEVEFPEVFLVGNGREVAIGRPTVPGARVRATVLGADRMPKVLVFKKKKTKQYKRTIGHRQHVLAIRIDDIDSGGTVMPLEPQAQAAARPKKTGARQPRKKAAPAKAKAPAQGTASRARRTAASAGKAAPAAGVSRGAKSAPAKSGGAGSKAGGRKPAGGKGGKGAGRGKRPGGGRG